MSWKYVALFALVLAILIQEVVPASVNVEDPYGGGGGSKGGGSKGGGSKGGGGGHHPKPKPHHPKPKASHKPKTAHTPKPQPKPVHSTITCLNGAGVCQDADSLNCDAGYKSGLCPGASNIKCCPNSAPNDGGNDGGNGGNNGSNDGGNDNSGSTSTATWSGLGVDVSGACNGFSCMKSSGYNYAIIRCWRSTGTFDPYCIKNIQAAQNAGLNPVDVYMFPQPKGASGVSQANALLRGLAGSSFSGTIWVDVEQLSPYWSSTANNQKFFNDVVNTLQAGGASVGVYTSKSQWTPIMGSSFQGGSSFPLWYAHYDKVKAFSDWHSSAVGNFGGWTAPAMKQYNGDITVCGCGVDVNWAPN